MSSKDRTKRPNDAGQSRKPDEVVAGMACKVSWRARHEGSEIRGGIIRGVREAQDQQHSSGAGQSTKPDESLGMSWRGRHGEHGDQGMEEGDPRDAKKSRNPTSSKDRTKRPNDAGQS